MKRVLLALALAIPTTLLVVLLYYGSYHWGWDWTGLASSFSSPTKGRNYAAGKTLWDWLQLLVIPVVLAGVGIWFNARQKQYELEIAEGRQQDQVLSTYLDRMLELLAKRQVSQDLEGSVAFGIYVSARARTVTAVSQLNAERNVALLIFLLETGLCKTGNGLVDLHAANLQRADLAGVFLGQANLTQANLKGASLTGANLGEANLTDAYLRDANLTGATLTGATLTGAELAGAYLKGADLSGASITDEQLKMTINLEGAIMPDGRTFQGWDGQSYQIVPKPDATETGPIS